MFKWLFAVCVSFLMACASSPKVEQPLRPPPSCEDTQGVVFHTVTPKGWEVANGTSFACKGDGYQLVRFVGIGDNSAQKPRVIMAQAYLPSDDTYTWFESRAKLLQELGCKIQFLDDPDPTTEWMVDLSCPLADGSTAYRYIRTYSIDKEGHQLIVTGYAFDVDSRELFISAFEQLHKWTIVAD